MIHLGDITKIHGADVPVVDIICGGSPCQDLSVAGKRAGLSGERSGLFMEQIRIIKEMRANDVSNGRPVELARPRFCVWENVPGAFSSNGGKDFQVVLTEFARVAVPDAPDVPMPKDGKWSKCGCLYDELGRWSIAWRVHDAQFWGVPQRRKRIALVADFGGLAAPEILFERKGLSRDFEQGAETRQGASADAEGGAGESSYTLKIRGGVERDSAGKAAGKGPLIQTELSATLGVSQDQTLIQPACAGFKGGQSKDGGIGYAAEQSPTLSATPSALEPTVMCAGFKAGNGDKASGIGYEDEKSPTLASSPSGTNQVPAVLAVDMGAGKSQCGVSVEQTPTLATTHGGEPVVCLNDQCGGVMDVTSDKTQTLRGQTHGHPPIVLGASTTETP